MHPNTIKVVGGLATREEQRAYIAKHNPDLLQRMESASASVGGRYDRYNARYGDRYRGGPQGSRVGAQGSCPTGPELVGPYNGVNYVPEVCQAKPPRCDCHVIGATTLASTTDAAPPGPIASTGFAQLLLDSGDAPMFVPYYMFIAAFQQSNPANSTIQGGPVAVLLQDSLSGREPNLRRANPTDPQFGICVLAYGDEKELECVDWRPFSSTNNQQLTLTFYNPQAFGVHVCVNLWGLPAVPQG